MSLSLVSKLSSPVGVAWLVAAQSESAFAEVACAIGLGSESGREKAVSAWAAVPCVVASVSDMGKMASASVEVAL